MIQNQGNVKKEIIQNALTQIVEGELDLGWKKIRNQDMNYLVHQNLADMKILNLIGNNLTYQSMFYLQNKQFNNIQALFLNYNNIGSKGCKLLSKGSWSFLEILSLQNCSIQNSGILHLGKVQWKQLQTLSLNQNRINFIGFQAVKRLVVPKLRRFEVSYNFLTIQSYYSTLVLNCELKLLITHGILQAVDIIQNQKLVHLLKKRFLLLKQ